MTLTGILARAEKLVADNSPQILTALGVAGTITTAVLTGKAAVQADRVIRQTQKLNDDPEEPYDLTPRDKVKLTWKLYIPPVATGAVTIASIILANQIGTRRAAAMAAAYAVSERAYSEYKDEVRRRFGAIKEQSVRDGVAQHQVNENPVENRQVIITGGGNVLCFEPFTGRYFDSDMESLKKAMNDLNYRINSDGYASLSEFYDLVGLPHTAYSDDVGWKSDKLLELDISTTLASDGRPAISFTYLVEPLRNYYKVH